jgi:hypothetical protein
MANASVQECQLFVSYHQGGASGLVLLKTTRRGNKRRRLYVPMCAACAMAISSSHFAWFQDAAFSTCGKVQWTRTFDAWEFGCKYHEVGKDRLGLDLRDQAQQHREQKRPLHRRERRAVFLDRLGALSVTGSSSSENSTEREIYIRNMQVMFASSQPPGYRPQASLPSVQPRHPMPPVANTAARLGRHLSGFRRRTVHIIHPLGVRLLTPDPSTAATQPGTPSRDKVNGEPANETLRSDKVHGKVGVKIQR